MMIPPLIALMSNFTFYLLFVALGIFVWLACRSHRIISGFTIMNGVDSAYGKL